MRRVIQISPALLYGDAVGNVIRTIDSLVKSEGYEAAICAGSVNARVDTSNLTLLDNIDDATEDDILIYHIASAYNMVDAFVNAPGKKVVIYHNITPPKFFQPFDPASAYFCKLGLEQTRALAGVVDYAMADSSFNRQDLIDMGYTCPIDVVPVLVDFSDFHETEPNQAVLDCFKGRPGANVMFMGRVAPNKKTEDVIRAFAEYQNSYDKNARLFLTGSFRLDDPYYRSLIAYVKELGVRDVIFPGHIGFDEVVAFYRLADVFVCQSEHEGFCVPLLEAFAQDIPVVAYDAAAVGETMGGAGILLQSKEPADVACAMDVALSPSMREEILSAQRKRLEDFSYENVSAKLLASLKKILES